MSVHAFLFIFLNQFSLYTLVHCIMFGSTISCSRLKHQSISLRNATNCSGHVSPLTPSAFRNNTAASAGKCSHGALFRVSLALKSHVATIQATCRSQQRFGNIHKQNSKSLAFRQIQGLPRVLREIINY
jgi:hypothetical protein